MACGFQSLRIASFGKYLMTFRIELLYIEQNQIHQAEKLFYMLVPYASVAIQAYMNAQFLQTLYNRNQFLGLESRFASAKGYTTLLSEERTLTHGHTGNVVYRSFLAFALGVDGIGIGTIEASEVTSLQENYKAKPRAIEGAH